jgi:hypothetical protein
MNVLKKRFILQQKLMSVVSMKTLWNQLLYKWLHDEFTPSTDKHGNGQKNNLSECPQSKKYSTNAYTLYEFLLLESLSYAWSFNRYHLTNMQKIFLNPTPWLRPEVLAVSSSCHYFCNILSETKNFVLCIILLSCIVCELEKTSLLGLRPMTDL